ncbi:MAG: NAD(P)/FAD-dependent oxidoreductase [Halobacteriales archaeon]
MTSDHDAVVVGGGPAGLSAAVFLGRAEFDVTVVEHGSSILRRNAHLENYLGFPAGVNSRLLLDMALDQARRSGAEHVETAVESAYREGDGFTVETEDEAFSADYLLLACWADAGLLEGFDVELRDAGSKAYLDSDDGRTSVDGLYVAGRIAGQPHQTVVNAGHGARAALSLIHDSDVAFYHDWVAPEGYFTDRGRDVPPGCEEITEDERLERERRSIEVMQDYFSGPHGEEPTPHPSQR